ncbi:hypothetical protein [Paracoccus litorisediminis]|uniref:Uncharacterized protein n=1 Tax=Paracoccus litorisediminis TaxID=2006130 RepID=A0A844HQ72_9RHOB|nr:hypothetical protein [Paracoccus litorisediminis]MTH61218.1 hypothetical protein [Paracoccus litorisediminis]
MPAQGDRQAGFQVTQGRIALVLSLITLMTLFHQGSKIMVSYEYRLASLEQKYSETVTMQRDLTKELGRLAQSLNDLNIVLREVQIRQEEGK